MNYSKLSKKVKCKNCGIHVGIVTPARHMKCCQVILCGYCYTKHKCNKINIQNQCDRCLSHQGLMRCKNCQNKVFCYECDKILHIEKKFLLHERSEIGQKNVKPKPSEKQKINQIKEEMNVYELELSMIEKQINQKWEELINGIHQQFDKVLQLLADRKNEITQKLQTRKTKELNKYIPFHQINAEYAHEDEINLETSIKQFRKISQCSPQFKGKYQLSSKLFQELNKLVEKFNIKNLILRVQGDQFVKRNLKNSCILSTGSSNIGSGIRSKNVNSKLSKSTISWEWKEICDDTVEENQPTSKSKNQTYLEKIKSEKLFVNRLIKKVEGEPTSKRKKLFK